jgi:hypothetical protein
MAAARPLREVFAELAGDEAARHTDPAQLLRDSGHGDLPEDLVSEAVISFADTAPVEVAEHLAPYVAANSAIPAIEADAATNIDPPGWVEALATAPDIADLDSPDPSDGLDLSEGLDDAPELPVAAAQPPSSGEHAPYADVGFGLGDGIGTADPLDALDVTSYAEADVSDVSVGATEAAPFAADGTGNDSLWGDDADDEPADAGDDLM